MTIGAVPPRADHYQHRFEIGELGTARQPDNPTNTYVVHGMGGVGKSQLAAAYARSVAKRVDLLMWVTATNREAVVNAYARAWADSEHPPEKDAELAAFRFLLWLQKTEKRWLIVLDDVRSPDDLRGLWPNGLSGRTVVTTRRTVAAMFSGGRKGVEVGLFTWDQARDYLTKKLDSRSASEEAREVDLLAEALGRLPLALAQAASFMFDRTVSCATYRTRFTSRKETLSKLFPPDASADEYQLTVATTWSMSIAAADDLEPKGLCGPLMRVASLLDPNGFPRRIMETRAVVGYSPGASVNDCHDALANLARFSLIELGDDAEPGGVRVHTMVQRAVLDGLDRSQLVTSAAAAVNGVAELWPNVEVDPKLSEVLRANTKVLADHPDDLLWQVEGYWLLRRAGRSLGEFGLLGAELAYWTSLVEKTERFYGAEDFHSLIVRQDLARARGQAGDPHGAVAEFEALVPEHVRVLTAANSHTFNARHGLAWWRGEAGFREAAVSEFEDLVADLIGARGANDPQTLRARYSLGRWRGQAGNPEQARDDFVELAPHIRRELGEDTPLLLAARHDLAWWTGEAGDPAEAAEHFAHLLGDRRRVQGERHVHTLATRHDLGWWLGEAGNPAEAVAYLKEVLEDDIRFLGPDHPHTKATRDDVAWWQTPAESRPAGWPHGRRRDHAGRVPGDLPGLDFLAIDRLDVGPVDLLPEQRSDEGPDGRPADDDHPFW